MSVLRVTRMAQLVVIVVLLGSASFARAERTDAPELVAQPVGVVIGSFLEQRNASAWAIEVGQRLQRSAMVMHALVDEQLRFRVVVEVANREVADFLRIEAREAGLGASWVISLPVQQDGSSMAKTALGISELGPSKETPRHLTELLTPDNEIETAAPVRAADGASEAIKHKRDLRRKYRQARDRHRD